MSLTQIGVSILLFPVLCWCSWNDLRVQIIFGMVYSVRFWGLFQKIHFWSCQRKETCLPTRHQLVRQVYNKNVHAKWFLLCNRSILLISPSHGIMDCNHLLQRQPIDGFASEATLLETSRVHSNDRVPHNFPPLDRSLVKEMHLHKPDGILR